jgi:PleD family two-component response regulator
MVRPPLNRILIVEDEPDIQAIAQLALEAVGGFTVQLCSSGPEALEVAPVFQPDLILLDVMMPGMNGLMTLQALRELPSMANTPVMFITAKIQPQEVALYRDLGALDVIAKPFDPMTLAATINTSWQRQHVQTPTAEVDERFNELRTQFFNRIQERITQIDSLWYGLARNWNPEHAHTLQRVAHNLVGSGATFGLPTISERARMLELAIKAQIQRAYPPTSEQASQIKHCIINLKQAYNDIQHTFTNFGPRPASNATTPVLQPFELTDRYVNHRLIYLLSSNTELAKDLALQIGYFGYTANIYDTLSDVTHALQHSIPASLVIDSTMLQGDTIQELAQLRQTQLFPPIFFISNQDDIATRLQAVKAGGEAYFTIPVNISSLIDKLDSLSAKQEVEAYRILIIDDEIEQAEYFSHTLEQAGMITAVVSQPLQVMNSLIEFMPDLILMDMYMPDCSGLELAAVIRQLEAYVSIPIVFLSMENDLDRQLEAIQIGGDQFLTKPIQPAQLVTAITSRVKRSQILRSLMVRDSLTGLLKHTVLKERLQVELARARRQSTHLSFAMIDIDHFKSINDTYGHITGDRVIKSLRCDRALRRRGVRDHPARYQRRIGPEGARRVVHGLRAHPPAIGRYRFLCHLQLRSGRVPDLFQQR